MGENHRCNEDREEKKQSDYLCRYGASEDDAGEQEGLGN